MHARKARMHALADGLHRPTGAALGTLDELFETLTWKQIGEHHKPVGLIGTYATITSLGLKMIAHFEKEGLIFPEHREAILQIPTPETAERTGKRIHHQKMWSKAGMRQIANKVGTLGQTSYNLLQRKFRRFHFWHLPSPPLLPQEGESRVQRV